MSPFPFLYAEVFYRGDGSIGFTVDFQGVPFGGVPDYITLSVGGTGQLYPNNSVSF
jgi:hypothetical protein